MYNNCVCVCERKREGEREGEETKREREAIYLTGGLRESGVRCDEDREDEDLTKK